VVCADRVALSHDRDTVFLERLLLSLTPCLSLSLNTLSLLRLSSTSSTLSNVHPESITHVSKETMYGNNSILSLPKLTRTSLFCDGPGGQRSEAGLF
jgi:hypothetical protein